MKTTLEILDMVEEFSKIKLKRKGNEIILPNPVEFAKKKWYSEEEIKEKINSLIDFLEKKQKHNFIYRELTTDELHCFVLDKLEMLKENFGDEE